VKQLLARFAVVSSVVVGGPSVLAQQAAPAATPPSYSANAGRFGVAVVDVSYIFKSYPKFTQQINVLKEEMKTADADLKTIVDRLTAKEQQRDTLKPGSPEFKQLDEELAREKADFSIKQGTVRRDFLEREARVYYSTYMEVANAIKFVAQQNNIGMVLRFNGDPIDPQQREDVMRAIMQPIVHQNSIDITPDVLLVLGVDVRKLPPQTPAPSGAGPVANRPTGGVQQR
jgi:Skp family chaperone for outer membrane proteins